MKPLLLFTFFAAFFFNKVAAQSCTGIVANVVSPAPGTVSTKDSFTVPASGPYKIRITAKGAQGGNGGSLSAVGLGGATVQGDFIVATGQVLSVVAGAPGGNGANQFQGGSSGGGGGGASGVYVGGTNFLIAAGGGGSAGGQGDNAGDRGGNGLSYNGVRTCGFGPGRGGGFGGGGYGSGATGGLDATGRGNSGGGGGGGYTGGCGGNSLNSGGSGSSFNQGTNQSITTGNSTNGGQITIECLGAAIFSATVSPTQPACGSAQGSLDIDLIGDVDGNTSGDVEYAVVSGNTFTGTPTFTDITTDPFVVYSGFGTQGTPGGSTYTVRVRLKYNPTIFTDYSYTLTAVTSPSTPATTTNNALNFNGTNNTVAISNCNASQPIVNGGNEITIEYWFKGSNIQSAVRFQDGNGYVVAGWATGVHILSNDGGTGGGLSVGAAAMDGNWHHVAMTWKRNTTNGFVSYLDGQNVAQRNSADVPLPTINTTYLGSYNGSSEFMNGSLDEVRVWNIARTQAQIQAGMNDCNFTQVQSGLLAYYKFDHGTANSNNSVNTLGNYANPGVFNGSLQNFALSGSSSCNWVNGRVNTATRLYVDSSATSGSNDGLSWQNAFTSLQSALNYNCTNTINEIWVAAGTYQPAGGSSFSMKNGIAIYGGFAGGETALNQRNWTTHVTILQGNGNRVINNSGLNGTAVLDGCTITGGNINDNGGGMNNLSSSPTITNCSFSGNNANNGFGGGIYNVTSSPTITNCSFSGNNGSGGGGMYNLSSSPTISNCSFSGNNGGGSGGGGIYNISSNPTIAHCSFSGNNANNGFGGGMYNINSNPTIANCSFSGNKSDLNGGGMSNEHSSSPTITNCIFSGNNGSSDGGGMYNNSFSSPTITNCSFSGNKGSGNGGGMYNINSSSPTITNCSFSGNNAITGGGIYNISSSSPTITNCIFSGNESVLNGGGMYSASSSPTITNCSFSGNNGSGNGGGMYNINSSSPTIVNCSFSGNKAANGGGIYNATFSSPTITNCSFSGNKSDFNGGGMYNFDLSNPNLKNCIMWGNSSEVVNSSSAPSYTNCLVKGLNLTTTGTGNLDGTLSSNDPLFVSQPDFNSAPGTAGNLRLQPCSPVINKGDNSLVPTGITTDLDGNARIFGGTVDMGAYEYQGNAVITTSSTSLSLLSSQYPYIWNGQSITQPGSYVAHFTNANGCDSAATLNVSAGTIAASTLNFDGADDYVGLPTIVPTTDFTVAFWFKTSQPNGGLFATTTAGDTIPGLPHDREIYLQNGNLGVYVYNPTLGTTFLATTGTNYADGNWHHVALTLSSADGEKMYVDGTLKLSAALTASAFTWSTRTILGYDLQTRQYLNGNMDEVMIWSKALTRCEVNSYRNCELATLPAELIAYYHFNQGVANGDNPFTTTLTDATANAYHGALTNFALTGNAGNWVENGAVLSGVNCSGSLASSTSETAVSICNKYTWNGTVYKASGDYFWHGANTTGCDSTATLHLTILSVTSTYTKTDVSCYGNNNGSITINPTYGVSPFTYRIGTVGAYGTNNTFINLKPGKYRVSILDVNGCAGVSDQVTILQTTAIGLNISKTNVTCYLKADGTITANGTGGSIPYQYRFGTAGTFSTTNRWTGLAPGIYSVLVKDANGCTASGTATITQATAPVSATATKTDESCPNAKNGSISVTAAGGTPGYKYRFGTVGSFGTAYTFNNLKAGSYRVFVNDVGNCTGYSVGVVVAQTLPTCTISTRNLLTKTDIPPTQQGLVIQLTPNPSNNYFTLRVKASTQEALQIKVIDINGRSLFAAKGLPEQSFKFGESFAPGVYMIEVRQGETMKTLKAVKIK